MWPVGHFEVLGLSCFRGRFVLLDCGHCYCSRGKSNIYINYVYLNYFGIIIFLNFKYI